MFKRLSGVPVAEFVLREYNRFVIGVTVLLLLFK